MSFETKVIRNGSLAQIAPLFTEMDTSAELTNARYEDEGLRNKWFYTANFAMYTLEHGEGYVYFGGREANPILNNLTTACAQLINHQRYLPGSAARQAVLDSVRSGHTLRMKLSNLELEKSSGESAYFEIDTANYQRLNEVQRLFAEQVYGEGELFLQNMEIFFEVSIFKTRIFVLHPDYVGDRFTEGEADSRACWLYIFDNYSKFNAIDTNVGNVSAVRGFLDVADNGEADE